MVWAVDRLDSGVLHLPLVAASRIWAAIALLDKRVEFDMPQLPTAAILCLEIETYSARHTQSYRQLPGLLGILMSASSYYRQLRSCPDARLSALPLHSDPESHVSGSTI